MPVFHTANSADYRKSMRYVRFAGNIATATDQQILAAVTAQRIILLGYSFTVDTSCRVSIKEQAATVILTHLATLNTPYDRIFPFPGLPEAADNRALIVSHDNGGTVAFDITFHYYMADMVI